MRKNKKIINIIGSTGSIGKNAFEIIKNNLDIFETNILLGFNNIEEIIRQAEILNPKIIFISKKHINNLLEPLGLTKIKIFPTEEFVNVLEYESDNFYSDITLLSVKGFDGLKLCLDIMPFSKKICISKK